MTIHTIADLENLLFFIKTKQKNLGLSVFKKHIPKTNDVILKGIGNVEGKADRCLQSHCTY